MLMPRAISFHFRFPYALAAMAGISVVSLAATPAHADTALAVDLDLAAPIDSIATTGGGFGIRAGYQAHFPLLVMTPEVGFDYHHFSGDYALKVYRGTGGLRVGIGEILRPGAFVHIGVGQAGGDSTAPPSHTGLTYDVGGFLDLTLLPLLNIGVHAAYNRLDAGNEGPIFEWATVGAHAALIF